MNTTHPLALVTGASSGIGADLALELARSGHDLLLTGRDTPRLDEVATRVRAAGAVAEVMSLDLAASDAVTRLTAWVGARPLAVVVNNAGFGGSDPVAEADPAVISSMISLNVTTLTLVTRAFLPGLLERKSGRILNVASTAAFGPIPGMAVYAATKAYVLSFSEALAEELAGTGVTVTTLCPGPTATRFAERADVAGSSLFKTAMTSQVVARLGFQAMLRGQRVRVTGAQNRVIAFASRLVPRALVTKAAKALMAQ